MRSSGTSQSLRLFYTDVVMKKISGRRLPGKVKVFYELSAAGGKNHWFLNWLVSRPGKMSLFIYKRVITG